MSWNDDDKKHGGSLAILAIGTKRRTMPEDKGSEPPGSFDTEAQDAAFSTIAKALNVPEERREALRAALSSFVRTCSHDKE